MAEPRAPGGALIDRMPPRALFAELVAGAVERTRVHPTPQAAGYLIELLQERVRPASGEPGPEPSFAEGLLQAQLDSGPGRLRRLRCLGDRALFCAGFFGDSLARRPLGLGYYADAGRTAYAALAAAFSPARSWAGLFGELARRFPDFVEVLTEVADGTRAQEPGGLELLYARYLDTGSDRDRRRLTRRGHALPATSPRRPQ
jgi:hypothetical protein